MNYKVRFHLGRGKNYQMWQVTNKATKKKRYYDPAETTLILRGCVLGNRPGVARKIFEGENKTVCAWVDCEFVDAVPRTREDNVSALTQYKYNPKKNPHWFTITNDNADKTDLQIMVTLDRRMYG